MKLLLKWISIAERRLVKFMNAKEILDIADWISYRNPIFSISIK